MKYYLKEQSNQASSAKVYVLKCKHKQYALHLLRRVQQQSVVGYVPLRNLRKGKVISGEDVLVLDGCEYALEKLKLFRHVIGYLEVKDDNGNDNVVGLTSLSILPLLSMASPLFTVVSLTVPVALAVAATAFGVHVHQRNQTDDTTIDLVANSTEVLEVETESAEEAVDFNSDEYNQFMGYGRVTVSSRNPIIALKNSSFNTSYAKQTIYKDGKVIYETGLIAPGSSVDWNAVTTLGSKGAYKLTQVCAFYDVEFDDTGAIISQVKNPVEASNPSMEVVIE